MVTGVNDVQGENRKQMWIMIDDHASRLFPTTLTSHDNTAAGTAGSEMGRRLLGC